MARRLAALALFAVASSSYADDARERLRDGIDAHEHDRAALEQDLKAVEALLEANADDSDAVFLRGRVLGFLDQPEAAIASYRRAAELSKDLAPLARYNIGCIYGDLGKHADAMAEWESVLLLDPTHEDAHYNLGQNYYLDGRFELARKHWEAVKKKTPDNFQVARKMVQIYWALGRETDAMKAREDVYRIRRDGLDPEAKADAWCFDQLVLPGGRVYAYETFEPAAGAGPWFFKVADSTDGTVARLDLAPKDKGFVLRVTDPKGAKAKEKTFAAKPSWKELKPAVSAMARPLQPPAGSDKR
jgi:tetratricopeptide (TPR) repeat protein